VQYMCLLLVKNSLNNSFTSVASHPYAHRH